jgi:hypothetical protein
VSETAPGASDPTDNWYISLLISGFPTYRIVWDHKEPNVVFGGFYSVTQPCPPDLHDYLDRTGVVLVFVSAEATTYQDFEHIPYDFLLGPSVPPYRHHGVYMPWSWLHFINNRLFPVTDFLRPATFDARAVLSAKMRFCAFVYNNCNDRNGRTRSFRNSFFQALAKYKFVHAPGLCMHNSDDDDFRVYGLDDPDRCSMFDNTIAHLRKYKFVISMENLNMTGYQTEKLPIALLAGPPRSAGTSYQSSMVFAFAPLRACCGLGVAVLCLLGFARVHGSPTQQCAAAATHADAIPIYWGDGAIADAFNPARFINLNSMSFEVGLSHYNNALHGWRIHSRSYSHVHVCRLRLSGLYTLTRTMTHTWRCSASRHW